MSTAGPLGDFRAALEVLESMISNCAVFQTATGAANAAEAAGFIYWPGQKPYTDVATKGRKKSRTWPAVWVMIKMGEGAGLDLSVTEGGGCYVPNVPLEFWIQRQTLENEKEDSKLESKNFLQLVGVLLRELAALSHTEGNLYVSELAVETVLKDDEHDTLDSMEALIRVGGRG